MPYEVGDVPSPPTPESYPPVILNASLPNGTIGVLYSQSLTVEDGTAPYTFSLTAGSLPNGLTLVPGGSIAGTPTRTGTFTFILTVTDSASLSSSTVLSILIPPSPMIANGSLPAGTVGVPYQGSLSGQGGAAPYGYQVLSGALPPGLTLATTGGITGTPTTAGMFAVTIQIYDSNSPQGIGAGSYGITIAAASLNNIITTMDEVVLLAAEDGGLYAIVPGQRYDTNYAGTQVGILQQWFGVPGSTANLALMQLGGASLSAKGNGAVNVTAIDDDGDLMPLTKTKRPMILEPDIEIKRDFMVVGAVKSERWGIGFDNGGVIGNWFEMHTAIVWVRKFFSGRKG